MFTPPPSPLPMPRDLSTNDRPVKEKPSEDGQGALENLDPDTLTCNVHRKAVVGRRFKWAILTVPIFLVFITLLSRAVTRTGHEPWPVLTSWDKSIPTPAIHRRSPQQDSATTTLPPQTQQTIPPVPAIPPVLPTPFPAPLTQANDFTTQGCQAFYRNLTQSEPFLACRPFSLLIQFSNTFLNQAQANLSLLNTLMWGTCNTRISAEQCTANMNWFAGDIQNACRVELSQKSVLVQSTLAGLQAYSVMRTVGCLTDQKPDPSLDSYCYVNAVQARNPSDMYYYNLPLGTALPNGTRSSCSACTKSVLNVYEDAHNKGGVPSLDSTYDDAVDKTQTACGMTYVQAVNGATVRWNGLGSVWWTALLGTIFVVGILGTS